MKIALINPPGLFSSARQIAPSQCLGLRSISAVLKSRGHEVCFIDALMLGFSNIRPYANGQVVGLEIDRIVERIPADTDLIGISAPFSQHAPVVHKIASLVRGRLPCATIAIGGVYPSAQPRLALTSDADLVVVGEGEKCLASLADGTGAAPGMQGVYTRADAARSSFPPAPPIRDLDALPFPDFEIPQIERYFETSPRRSKRRTASMVTSRGCPFDCGFCSVHPISGYRWRKRSAENVLGEIRYLVDHHGISTIEFEDDNFTLDTDRAKRILEGIIRLNERGTDLWWESPNGIRIDTLDEEIVGLARRSNCRCITLALESGDPEMLDIMNKRLDLGKAFQVLQWCAKHKIPRINLFYMVGYPGETAARFERGVAYLREITRLGGNTNLHINIAQPYPGTRLLERCLAEGYIRDPAFADFLVRRDLMSSWHTVSIVTQDFDMEEIARRLRVLDSFAGTTRLRRALKRALPAPLTRLTRRLLGRKRRSLEMRHGSACASTYTPDPVGPCAARPREGTS